MEFFVTKPIDSVIKARVQLYVLIKAHFTEPQLPKKQLRVYYHSYRLWAQR